MIMLLSHQRINNHIQYGPNNMQMAFLARLHIVKYNFGLIYSIICVTLYYLHQIFLPSGDSKKIALFSILFSQQPYEVDLAKGGGGDWLSVTHHGRVVFQNQVTQILM